MLDHGMFWGQAAIPAAGSLCYGISQPCGLSQVLMSHSPNILWICSDQQRWDTLGCYGNAFARTPQVGIGPAEDFHQTTWCVERAMDFIGQREEGRPWFYSINMVGPHHPFDPPEAYLQPYLDRLSEIPLPTTRRESSMTCKQTLVLLC